MELYVGHRPWITEESSLSATLQDKKALPAMPVGLGSAFAALPPPPPLPDLRLHDSAPRYLWEPTRLLPHHHTHHPSVHHSSQLIGASSAPSLDFPLISGSGARLGTSPLGHSHLSPPIGATSLGSATLGVSSLALADPHHPAYRISPYMEHLYHSLHTSPQASLRGLSPLDHRGDYLSMSGLAATRLSDPHMVPSALTSADLTFSIDGSRLASPRPSLRQSRKRALSSSPYSDSFDLNSMIRFSPNSLVSIMNGSRTSSASGSYGHLSAGAISPSLGGVPHPSVGAATTHLQQLQAHLMRGGSLPTSPFLAPSPLLPHTPSTLTPHQSLFLSTHQPLQPPILTSSVTSPSKAESEKKDPNSISRIAEEEKNHKNKNGGLHKDMNGVTPISRANGTLVNGGPVSAGATVNGGDEEGMKEEPPDFIETHCHWRECNKDFNTPDDLVKHINADHIHANKKSFVCRWKDCSRTEKPFKAQYMLVVHMRRHTGEKPHRCTFEGCFKAYSRLENLKTHLRSHTGEKPYMCEFPGCTKAFSNASDRAKHQNRTHSNEKPYVCKAPGCIKRYTDPSSLRKHVKTVHGAEFYASKKHKGNDHPNGTPGGQGPNKGGKDQGDGSPTSDGAKGGSMSSPSVKSEESTSPGNHHSPDTNNILSGGVTPMDQSRLGDHSRHINGGRIFDGAEYWDAGLGPLEDDLENGSIDIPLVGGMAGGSGGLGVAVHPDRALRYRPMKGGRMQAKGMVGMVPKRGLMPGPESCDFGQKMPMSDMKGTVLQNNRKTAVMNGNNRRDSNSTVSTGYFSMQSPNSRRASELSQTSCMGGAVAVPPPSLYDSHLSIGGGNSSRRSSDNSTYNSFTPNQMFRNSRNSLCPGGDIYNTSNLVVQTQNMSLSQDNLSESHGWSANTMTNTMGNSMSAANTMGFHGPMGPIFYDQNGPNLQNRRASDPVRPLDRPMRGATHSGRLTRTNSFSNLGPIKNHPNQGLQLDQDDEPIENKLILPDDMVNYLNQKEKDEKITPKTEETDPPSVPPPSLATFPSPAYSSPAHTSLPVTSPPYNPNTPQTYPNIATPPTPYQYGVPPTPASYTSAAPSPAIPPTNPQMQMGGSFNYNTPMPSPAPMSSPIPPTYHQQPNYHHHQYQQNSHTTPFNPQFHQNVTNSTHHQQMYNQMMYNQRFGAYGGSVTPAGNTGYPQHMCGHFASVHMPPTALQMPCPSCQGRSSMTMGGAVQDNPAYSGNWQMNAMGMNHYAAPYTNHMSQSFNNYMGYNNQSMNYNHLASSTQRDIQCGDVSQSTSNENAKSNVHNPTPKAQSSGKPKAQKQHSAEKPAVKSKTTVETAPVLSNVQPQPVANGGQSNSAKNPPTKNPTTGEDTENNNYMKQDTYQRTLEYVQQCQNWTTVVKDEVSSTTTTGNTEQKPTLNPNGSVNGYIPPTVTAPAQPPTDISSLIPHLTDGIDFITPLNPVSVSESSNMVLNNLSSSLNSLQQENKYFQMLQ